MRKIIIAAAGIAAAGTLAFSPVAFAEVPGIPSAPSIPSIPELPGPTDPHVIQHPVQECGHHETEGTLTVPEDEDSSNSDSHDGECEQELTPEPADS